MNAMEQIQRALDSIEHAASSTSDPATLQNLSNAAMSLGYARVCEKKSHAKDAETREYISKIVEGLSPTEIASRV